MTEVLEAFQEWKKKWNKKYESADEEKIRFGDFEQNFRDEVKYSDDPPKPLPLWDVLNNYADRPRTEHFGYIRLDRDADSDDDYLPKGVTLCYMFPVKLKDGTTIMQWGTSSDDRRKRQSEADAAVLPVKRPSSSDDDKDDTKEEDLDDDDDVTVKRPKIGCGVAKNEDVAMTLENEES